MTPSDPPTPTPFDDPGTFARRMEALVQMSAALTGLDDERRLFEVAKEYLGDLMPVGRASLGLVDDYGQLRVWGLQGSGVERAGDLLDVEGSALHEVMRTGRPFYQPVAAESTWPDVMTVAGHGYGSALVVPLPTGWATIGTLNMARVETHGFSSDDIRLLEHAGRLLGVSILSIRRLAAATSAERASTLAHELAAQRVRDIETINRVFRILDDVSPIDQRLSRAARELGSLRGVDRCVLALVGDDGKLAPVVPPGGSQGRRREDSARPDRRRAGDEADPWTALRQAVAERRPIWDGHTEHDGFWQAGHLAVPVIVRDQAAGALALVAQQGALGASQGVLAETVAGQIANALERNLMFDELKRAAETADATSRARSQFLANMSHELRTPMNGVIGMTGLLEATELTPQQRGYVETIRISGEAQVAVINHILDFTKIEAARLELQLAPFDLRACVEDALDLAAATLGTKPVELSYDIAADLPHRYLGDATRVRQVLINLVSNAVKFTERGEVTVQVVPDGPGRLLMAVIDTGVGIPPDRIEWLFEPFTQLAAAPGQGAGGSGLGLAISRQLVELMGGTISASSEPGRGSTFRIAVPLPAADDLDGDGANGAADGADSAADGADGALGDLTDRVALVAGLGPANRAALVNTLERWGMTVHTGDDLTAWDASAPRPDVALVDSRLRPAVDGIAGWDQLTRALGIPVIPLCPVGLPPGAPPPGGPTSLMARPIKPAALLGALRVALSLQPAALAPGSAYGPAAGGADGPVLGEIHPLRVLVAEDNRVNQRVALALLERLGYTADVAADGLEAVAAATLGPGYDLVLMDLKMPGIDGIEAARRIRRLLPRHAPRIVAMTADTIAVVRSSCLNAGMAGFVPKPVRIETLAEVLRNTPPTAPVPSVIDEAALATLADLVAHDPTAIDDIVGVWVADTPGLVRDVQTAYDQGSPERVAEAAHPLVSSSATVGALTLSAQAAAIERDARDGRLPPPVALAQLRIAADQAVTALVRRRRTASPG
ncbi:MAG: ATP-binding protein [Acidimicrobiales bacterium]